MPTPHKRGSRLPSWAKKTLIVIFWLLVWQLAALLINNDILLASPLQTAWVLLGNAATVRFWASIGFTLLRIFLGFTVALLLALALGALAWKRPLFKAFLNPAVTFIKSVPIVCFIVMLLIWFGARWVSFAAVLLVAFPAIYFAVLEGLTQRDQKLLEMLRVFRVPGGRRLTALYWPTILPFLQAASKVAVGMSWKSGVAAELIGLPLGSIGANIYQAKILLQSADIFAWTFVIVALSIAAEKAFLALLRRSEDWSWRMALPRFIQENITESIWQTPTQVTAQGLVKSFDDKPVIDNLNLTLAPAGRYTLNTPSGTGKTTLLRVLASLEKPAGGTLTHSNRIAMVFQEARLFEKRNAVENIQLVAGHSHSQAVIHQTLARLLPEDSLELPVSQLSGGMRRRVELCRALLAPSQLLLLDEPFAGLDPANTEAAMALLEEQLNGRTLLLVSHDQQDTKALSATPLSL